MASPDGRLVATVETGERLSWSLARDGKVLLAPSEMALAVAGEPPWGPGETPAATRRRSVRRTLRPAVAAVRSSIPEAYEELDLDFGRDHGLELRLYDDAAAYRWVCLSTRTLIVSWEAVTFSLPGDPFVWSAQTTPRPGLDAFQSSFEEDYHRLRPSEMDPRRPAYLPAVVESTAGPRLLVTESNLRSYPGLYLLASNGSLRGTLPAYPRREEVRGSEFKQSAVVEREPFLARHPADRPFPWRVVGVFARDQDLLAADLVWRLADGGPSAEQASWVRPGKATEEWIIDRRLYGVPFRAGVNTDTYLYYVDFAARHRLGYVLLDADWSDHDDLSKVASGLDLAAVAAYARRRGVGLILWTNALTVARDVEGSLDRVEGLGAAGFMVDFMDRDDQPTIEFEERVAAEAWKRRLIVNFHGVSKPTGLERLYPNVLTREGLMGHEYDKWSDRVTPAHNVTLPYLRMAAGPMDYEGGCMVNASSGTFRAVFERPMCQGTRAQALAAYVLYADPLAHLAGNPGDYERAPEATDLLENVPTTWDETVPLAGEIGAYAALARRHGEEWWVAAMTDWTPRGLELPTVFLGRRRWQADVWRDGPDADRIGVDMARERMALRARDPLRVRLAPGGGFVARMRPLP